MKGLKANGRRNLISGFFCTHHFLEMAWRRKIEIGSLEKLLKEIPKNRPESFCYIIPTNKCHRNRENALILKIKNDLLITGFFVKLDDYMGKNLKDHFIISRLTYKI